jgi:creatinine amidohydrolase/Fe(II)-dependent formamide hydrolase-like protein
MKAPVRLLLLVLLSCFAFLSPSARAVTGSVFIEDRTWTEVRDMVAKDVTTAIYYAGSTEQNGPHMALGKHNFIARHVAQRIAEELGDALVFPILPFAPTGDPAGKTGHMKYPGSVSVSEATYAAVAEQVARSAIAAGFRRVVLMGDHGGGQEALKKVAERLDRAWSPRKIRVHYIADLYYKSAEQVGEYLSRRGLAAGLHAGMPDTSELMAVDTQGRWVRADKLAAPGADSGVDGDPRAASAEAGEQFLKFKVANAVAQIRRLAGAKR